MELAQALPTFAAVGILVLSVLTGPLVSPALLPSTDAGVVPGAGSADVEVVSVPERGTLTPARHSTSGYVISVPPSVVHVSNLSGNPMVVYKLRLAEHGYVTGTTHILDGSFTGRQTLLFEDSILDRTSLEREIYRAELHVLKRVNERDTVLYQGNVTLEVMR